MYVEASHTDTQDEILRLSITGTNRHITPKAKCSGMSAQDITTEERLPLFLLFAEEGEEVSGITRFQKLVFLAQKGGLSDDPIEPLEDMETFEYEPNDYGPFSRELYDALDDLEADGLVEVETKLTRSGNERKDYVLTKEGERTAENLFGDLPEDPTEFDHDLKVLKAVKRLYNDRPIVGLIDDLYAEYPEYAKDSVLR